MKKKKGFSLIEILIVMAILGILMLAGVGNYYASLKSSRDARRKADLSTIQKGLESYYNDNGIFPASTASSNLCASDINCYLRTTPSDPSGGASYCYIRGIISGTNQSYQMYAKLERTQDINYVSYGTPAGCAAGTWTYGVSSTNTTP